MRSKRSAKVLVIWQPGFIGGLHIKINKALALFFGNMKIPAHVDQMRKTAHLFSEAMPCRCNDRYYRREVEADHSLFDQS